MEQDLLKFINNTSKNNNANINNKHNLIKKQFSFNENKNKNYNIISTKSKAQTPQKILDQLQRVELELKRNISKLIQKEKNIKEKSYIDLNRNENKININPVQNKEISELKQISENKEIYSSQLNEIKFRINLLQDKYNKKNGIYNNNYKENMDNYIQSQLNIKNNNKINMRLKELQIQSQRLISNMKKNAEKKLKEKEDLTKKQEKLEIENNKMLLDKLRKEEKENIKKRKNNSITEIKRMKEGLKKNKKTIKVKKEYIYQKMNLKFNQKMKETITTANTKRKNFMKSLQTSNNNINDEFIKNYQLFKNKKNLELNQKTKMLKKSWSERELLLPKYKSEISLLLNEEEKNKKQEKKINDEKKTVMKIKQIKYSNKYEDNITSAKNIVHNPLNKNNSNVNIKFNYINNYCNLIRNKLPKNSNEKIELKNPLKLKKNHIDLTKCQNSINITKLESPNIKLPNIKLNSDHSKNKEKIEQKFLKNNNIYKFRSKEIQNLIEKNGINNATINIINSKLENLNQKKEQKNLIFKYQGGFASNPDLGQEVSDILIDTIEAKMSLIEGIQNMKNDKNLIDNKNDIKENEEENKEIEND